MCCFSTSGGKAATPAGDGRLVPAAAKTAGRDVYSYDPRDPVPSLYGKQLYTIPADQRPLESRHDILVYQTEPLAEPIEVTGNPEVELFASSSTPDTDFFVRLIDVAPDGLARDVSLGMVRARYREALDKPTLLTPGQITKFTIRMNPTSNQFLAGHRLRPGCHQLRLPELRPQSQHGRRSKRRRRAGRCGANDLSRRPTRFAIDPADDLKRQRRRAGIERSSPRTVRPEAFKHQDTKGTKRERTSPARMTSAAPLFVLVRILCAFVVFA